MPLNFTLGDILKNLQQFSQHPNTMQEPIIPSPAPAQPQPAPASMPALPNLGQMANQGGGLGSTLANMGKSFLNTTAQALPPALAYGALFGDTPAARQMTYASVVNQLEQKREAAERRRIDKVAGISTFLYSMQQYGKNYNVKPEDIEMALMTGTKTGVTEIDNQIGQAYEALQPMIQSNEINSADILEGMKKRAEYVKLMEGEKTKYQHVPGSEGQFFDPENIEGGAITIPGFKPEFKNLTEEQLTMMAQRGDKEAQAVLDAMQKRKIDTAIAGRAPKEITPNKIEAGVITKFLGGGKLTPQEEKIKEKYFAGGKDTYADSQLRWQAKLDSFEKALGRKASVDEKRRIFISDPYGILAPDNYAPEAKSSSSPSGQIPQEGQTAVNPKTGERLIYKNGQWKPLTK